MKLSEYTLWYYNSDDGTWIKHEPCQWEVNLGFNATVDDALRVAAVHGMECSSDS